MNAETTIIVPDDMREEIEQVVLEEPDQAAPPARAFASQPIIAALRGLPQA